MPAQDCDAGAIAFRVADHPCSVPARPASFAVCEFPLVDGFGHPPYRLAQSGQQLSPP